MDFGTHKIILVYCMINIFWGIRYSFGINVIEISIFNVNNSEYHSGETFQLSEIDTINFSVPIVQNYATTVVYKNDKIIRSTEKNFIIYDSELIDYIYVSDGSSVKGTLYVKFDFPTNDANVYGNKNGFEIIQNNVFKFTVSDSCPTMVHYFSENCPHMGSSLRVTPSYNNDLVLDTTSKMQVLDTRDGFMQISSYIYKLTVTDDTPDTLHYFSATTPNNGGAITVEDQ